MGSAYLQEGLVDHALKHFRKSLQIKKALLGENHVWLTPILNALGKAYYRQGAFSEAIEQHEACLRIRRDEYGEENVSVADSYQRLGA